MIRFGLQAMRKQPEHEHRRQTMPRTRTTIVHLCCFCSVCTLPPTRMVVLLSSRSETFKSQRVCIRREKPTSLYMILCVDVTEMYTCLSSHSFPSCVQPLFSNDSKPAKDTSAPLHVTPWVGPLYGGPPGDTIPWVLLKHVLTPTTQTPH